MIHITSCKAKNSSCIKVSWSYTNEAGSVVVNAIEKASNLLKSSLPQSLQPPGSVCGLSSLQQYKVHLTINGEFKDRWCCYVQIPATSNHSFMKERIVEQPSDLQIPEEERIHAEQLFDLLVPEKGYFIGHYERQGTKDGWKRFDRLILPSGKQVPDTAVSHIQSFRAPEHLNALALLQPGGALVAFEYKPNTGDQKPFPVIVGDKPVNQVHGAPALVQTDQGLFHLLVSLPDPDQQINQIVHLVQSNETIQKPWKQVAALPVPEGSTVISIALVQADSQGGLKAVVRVRPPEGSDSLVSYQCDLHFHWQGPFDLSVVDSEDGGTISNVVGAPGLVQSIFGDQEQLDLLVPIANVKTGDITLTQFSQPAGVETNIAHPWRLVATLRPLNDDPHTQVVSASITQDSNRNLQCIAYVITSKRQNLLAFYIFDPKTGWSQPSIITTSDGKPIVVGQGRIRGRA